VSVSVSQPTLLVTLVKSPTKPVNVLPKPINKKAASTLILTAFLFITVTGCRYAIWKANSSQYNRRNL
ncbi:hypothetical protein, partial [Vibrio tasmaniensis]